uniref:Uncharacterized protein n=1 Tax=Coccidioides posadasii RMSCC 3488 TaxID=454284 RepID=A0A0J6F5C0_COCPO|nr:hypothetical protein CPAG_00852 [Coccidioides posadasii RMSCC 3488]
MYVCTWSRSLVLSEAEWLRTQVRTGVEERVCERDSERLERERERGRESGRGREWMPRGYSVGCRTETRRPVRDREVGGTGARFRSMTAGQGRQGRATINVGQVAG